MIASSRSYAIGMVHFQIGGGWKVIAIVMGVYLALFGGSVSLFFYADYMEKQKAGGPPLAITVGPVIVGLLMGIQGFVLLLIGGYRVSSSIRHDISSRMIESHRLMPITSANAVFGYLFGPTTPLTMFALLNLALSCAFGASIGSSFGRMVINQAVIFSFAVFVWSLISLATFIYRHMFFIGLAGMFLGTCTGILFYAFMLFPGFALLMTPFIGETVFGIRGGGSSTDFDAGYIFGISGQIALFALFFVGSCRLYRGTFPTAFSARQGMCLLATWAALSTAGIYHSDQLGFLHMFGRDRTFDEELGTAQIVASLASCIVLAAIPLWSFVQDERRKLQGVLIPIAAVAVTSVFASLPAWGAAWMSTFNIPANLLTLLAVAQIVTLYCLLRMTRSMRFIFAALISGGIMLVLWISPLILELIRLMIMRNSDGPEQSMSVLGTLSPFGLLGCLWGGVREVSSIPGLVWQWIAALFTLILSCTLPRRSKNLKPPAPGLPLPATSAPTSVPPLPASS